MKSSFDIAYKNSIRKVFYYKESLIRQILEDSYFDDYYISEKILSIKVKKPFIKTLIETNSLAIKDSIESETGKPISFVKINGIQINLQHVSRDNIEKQRTVISNDQKNLILSTTLEKTLENSVIKNKDVSALDDKKIKAISLEFYNKYLGVTKTIVFDKKYLHYESEMYLSAIFCWTIVVPMIFLPLAFRSKSHITWLLHEIKKLEEQGYLPLNQITKEFLNRYRK